MGAVGEDGASRQAGRQLCLVCGFARYSSATDPLTEAHSPEHSPYPLSRARPYLYSENARTGSHHGEAATRLPIRRRQLSTISSGWSENAVAIRSVGSFATAGSALHRANPCACVTAFGYTPSGGLCGAVRHERSNRKGTMKVLLTGGVGDLGQALIPSLLENGDIPVILDIRDPLNLKREVTFFHGSVLDRSRLKEYLHGCDCIVHIAAWHGIHEARGEKSAYDFFDLNVRGAFEVFQAAASVGIDKIIYISTTSVYRPDTLYGRSKLMGECIAENYGKYNNMNVITLRPRGFIPFWNRGVYTKYSDWAKWFWRGAVHIDDVAAAVMLALDLISRRQLRPHLVLTLDSAYEYTEADLDHWDADGVGSTFRKHYPQYYDLALSYGLDPALKPNRLDISEAVRWLGYRPAYSLASLLSELAAYGDGGPPRSTQ